MAAARTVAASALKRAGLLRRLAAAGYDALVVAALLMLATALLLPLTGGEAVADGNPWYRLYLLIIAGGYFVLSWSRGGQTLGMRAWRLQLRSRDGGLPGWRRATLRFILMLPLAPLLPWLCFDREGLALHDRLSSTEILHRPRD